MIDATGGTTTFARRWRAVYDVLLGVALFVSLLLPAMRQASSGTLVGLRNGMLLLLLDVVVLVMLSRYITSPSRTARLDRRAGTTQPQEVCSLEQVQALLDEDGALQESLGLGLDRSDVTVHQIGSASQADLAWSDCAAVVHSQVTLGNGTRFSYLQFVAVHEERIRRGPRDPRSRALARLLGLTEAAASMVWVVPPHLVRLPPVVLGQLEQQHPSVRIVRPDVPVDHAE
jgi:hypothetical protein